MKSNEIFKNAPTIALIHNISKNQIKYLNSHIQEFDLGREVRYIMMVYDNPLCSQDDLVNIYGESKANVAKAVKKLEDEGFIKREINTIFNLCFNIFKYLITSLTKHSIIYFYLSFSHQDQFYISILYFITKFSTKIK